MTRTTRGLIVGATAVMLAAVAVAGAGIHLRGQALQDGPKKIIDQVWQTINDDYVDGTFNQVDWKSIRTQYIEERNYSNTAEAYDAIREMLKKLDDPYTRFMDPKEYENMGIETSGALTGVGLQLAQDEETKKLVVIAPIEDTPAFNAGILAKDIIIQINDKRTEGMDVNQAVNLIRGEVNTQVTLRIQRGDQEIEYKLTRKRIEIHPVRFSLKETSTGKVGYIRLAQFSAPAAEEMGEAIKAMEAENVSGYILDLRSNPGGLLYASVKIARMFIPEGTIVSTVNRQGGADRQRADNRTLTDKPLVVLVDGGSASASEILSGALQDQKRAVLVGSQTFGKGLVQSIKPLSGGSGMAVTIAKYFTPSGRDINKAGIKPDITVDLTDEQKQTLRRDRDLIGTVNDPQFAKALEVLNKEIADRSENRAAQ